MSISNGKRFSPVTTRFISTLIICVIVMSIEFIFTGSIVNAELHKDEQRYYDSNSQMLEGYAKAIHYSLENYKTSLMLANNEKILQTKNPVLIQEWLKEHKPLFNSDFHELAYADLRTFKTYFDNGAVVPIGSLNIEPHTAKATPDDFIWDILYTDLTNEAVFLLEKPIFDEDDKIQGYLSASVKLEKLDQIVESISTAEHISVYIQDRFGKFIVHPKPEYIGKKYTPAQEKYKIASSSIISSQTAGITETVDENGTVVDLMYRKISDCGWIICIAIPKVGLKQIQKNKMMTKLLVFIISFFSLLLLLFLEMYLIDHFYKHQLIEPIYDPLTGLITRQRFEQLVEKQLKVESKNKIMIIEADIKGFKFLNQNYGEEKADELIKYFSENLNKLVSLYNGVVARGYADHFYIMLKVHNVRKAMSEFNMRLQYFDESVKNSEIPFFPKFGITFIRPDSKKDVTVKELLGQASFAKSTVRDNMIEPYAIYNDRILEKINEEHFIENNMEDALANEEFYIVYQPKILLRTDKIVGAEALVRWKTCEGRFFTPDKFIPLFEKNGFITKLDFYVYDKVFQFIEKQLKNNAPIVPISVNMSRNHNKPEKFMHDFMTLFSKYNIPPHFIQVEIIERSVMDDNTLQEITNRLHQAGFTVAMDDFGSGESSLNMLTKVPVDVLKFDRDFLLSSMNSSGCLDEKSARFIRSLLDLSKHLDKETIFEGVETQEQRDFLKSAECDQVQGYFYSRPLEETDFVDFIKQHD